MLHVLAANPRIKTFYSRAGPRIKTLLSRADPRIKTLFSRAGPRIKTLFSRAGLISKMTEFNLIIEASYRALAIGENLFVFMVSFL